MQVVIGLKACTFSWVRTHTGVNGQDVSIIVFFFLDLLNLNVYLLFALKKLTHKWYTDVGVFHLSQGKYVLTIQTNSEEVSWQFP